MTHEKILFLYISAIESGDLDTLRDIWALAEDDPKLSAKLIELNAEIGETPMAIYNGKVQAAGLPQRKSYRIPFTRAAILLFLLAGIIGIALSLSQAGEEPTTSVPLYGTTPTPAVPEDLTVITTENVAEMVEIDRFGSGIIQGAVWSHDGSQIVAYGESVWVFDSNAAIATPNEVDITHRTLESASLLDLPFVADMGVLAGDGSQLAIANHDGQSAIVDLNTGLVQELDNVDGEITDVAAHGNLIARIDGDHNLVYVWDLELGRERFVIRSLEANVNALAFSEDGAKLAVTGSVRAIGGSGLSSTFANPRMEHVVQVFDTSTAEMIVELDNPAEDFPYEEVAFNGNRLYAYFAPIFHWWDMDNLVNTIPVEEVIATAPDIASLAFTSDNRIVGLTQPLIEAGYAVLLDGDTFEQLQKFTGFGNGLSKSVDANDERILITTEYAILVFELTSEHPLQMVNNATSTLFDAVVSYPYAAVHDGHVVNVWNLETGALVNTWTGIIRDIEFSPNGTTLAVAALYGGPDNNLLLWDFVSDETQHIADVNVESITFDGPGESIAYITLNGELKVININTEATTSTIRLAYGDVYSAPRLDFHPASPLVAVTHWSREIEVYDIETESLVHTLNRHSDVVANLSFSHDGSIMASVDLSGNVIIWDTATWEEIAYRKLEGPGGNLAFSTDDTMLAVSSETDISVLDVKMLDTLHQFRGHSAYITGLDFDEGGKLLVSAGHDGTLRMWGIPE